MELRVSISIKEKYEKEKAKARKQKVKKEVAGYPKQLQLEEFFKCPIWFADEPKFVDSLNKASDKYIEASKKNLKPAIDKRNKNLVIKETWVMYFIQHH